MAHTPGPWKVMDALRTHIFTEGDAYGRGPMFVAEVRGWGHLTGTGGGCAMDYEKAAEIQDANATLIAAAPDLLAVLLRVRDELPRAELDYSTLADAIDAAIAKAHSGAPEGGH